MRLQTPTGEGEGYQNGCSPPCSNAAKCAQSVWERLNYITHYLLPVDSNHSHVDHFHNSQQITPSLLRSSPRFQEKYDLQSCL